MPASRALKATSKPRSAVELQGTPIPSGKRRLFRWVKAAGFAALCFGAILFGANVLAPSGLVEAQISTWLKEQTGRDVTVGGKTKLSFWPLPHIQLTDLVIGEPATGRELAVPRAEIDLGLSDLFSETPTVTRLVLERPVLAIGTGQRATTPAPIVPIGRGLALELGIKELRIHDGTVLIHSPERSEPRRFARINAVATLPATSLPAKAEGQFNWRGKSVGFNFDLASQAALKEAAPVPLTITVEADTVAARFDGAVRTLPDLSGQGTLTATTHSVRQFLAWLRGVRGVVPVPGEGHLASTLSFTDEVVVLRDIKFAQDNARGYGEAQVDLSAAKPKITGAFVLDDLNLEPLLAYVGLATMDAAPAPAVVSFSSAGSGDQTDWFSTPSDSAAQIEQAVVPPPGKTLGGHLAQLHKPGPGVSQPSLTISIPQDAVDRVLASEKEKSAAPLLFDADIDLSIRKAHLGEVEFGQSAASVALADRILTAKLWRTSLYGGDGEGTFMLNFGKATPSFAADLRFQGVETSDLLGRALGFEMLRGQGRLTVNVAAEGHDREEIALSLTGNGAFAVADGTLDGIAPKVLADGLKSGSFAVQGGPEDKTAFSVLAGSFDINHGIARTHNLRLDGSAVSARADGVVNLPRNYLDILVTSGSLAQPRGGGVAEVTEHLAPLRIQGPLQNPQIRSAADPLIAIMGGTNPNPGRPGIAAGGASPAKIFRPFATQAPRGNATATVGGNEVQPSALAPSFAPKDADGSPPLRMESLR